LLALKQKNKNIGKFVFFTLITFKMHWDFVALGMGFVVKIELGTGIWTKVGLGNGIWTPLQDPLFKI